jgi:hypothetical protein
MRSSSSERPEEPEEPPCIFPRNRDATNDRLGQHSLALAGRGHLPTLPSGPTHGSDAVADAILYFVTGADVVTGETLILDGGMHLNSAPLGRR